MVLEVDFGKFILVDFELFWLFGVVIGDDNGFFPVFDVDEDEFAGVDG